MTSSTPRTPGTSSPDRAGGCSRRRRSCGSATATGSPTHARSPCRRCLAVVPFLLALTGLAADIDQERPQRGAWPARIDAVSPARAARRAGLGGHGRPSPSEAPARSRWPSACFFALLSMTTAMAQVERGSQPDLRHPARPARRCRKYGRAAVADRGPRRAGRRRVPDAGRRRRVRRRDGGRLRLVRRGRRRRGTWLRGRSGWRCWCSRSPCCSTTRRAAGSRRCPGSRSGRGSRWC